MKPARLKVLWTLLGAALLVGAERLLRQYLEDGVIVSRLLAPRGLTDLGCLLLAGTFLVLRLLVAGCLPGILVARAVKLALEAHFQKRDRG